MASRKTKVHRKLSELVRGVQRCHTPPPVTWQEPRPSTNPCRQQRSVYYPTPPLITHPKKRHRHRQRTLQTPRYMLVHHQGTEGASQWNELPSNPNSSGAPPWGPLRPRPKGTEGQEAHDSERDSCRNPKVTQKCLVKRGRCKGSKSRSLA